jgi:Survival motor neuron (SMN) interacting protein 1 (SIP1)
VQIVMHYYHWLASSIDNPGKPLDIGAPMEDATDPSIALSRVDARWLFYLLAHLDSDLTGAKEMSLLRSLARVCVSLVRRSLDHSPEHRKSQAADDDNDGGEEGEINDAGNAMGEDLQTGRISCWMVLVAVISVWGQTDLWLEANARLHGSFHHGESVDTSNYEF